MFSKSKQRINRIRLKFIVSFNYITIVTNLSKIESYLIISDILENGQKNKVCL